MTTVAFSSISFVGLGTTARALSDRLGNPVNVLGFGADPTGGSDSYSAFQAAANYCFGTPPAGYTGTSSGADGSQSKGYIWIPAGDYRISQPIELATIVGGNIIGAGSACTRLTFTGDTGGSLNVNDGRTTATPVMYTHGQQNGLMQGFSLDITSTGSNGTVGLWLTSFGPPQQATFDKQSTQDYFIDIATYNATTGILLSGARGGDSNFFINCYLNNHYMGMNGITFNAISNHVVNCKFTSCGPDGATIPSPTAVVQGALTGQIGTFNAILACNFVNSNSQDIVTGSACTSIIGCRSNNNLASTYSPDDPGNAESGYYPTFITRGTQSYMAGCSFVTPNSSGSNLTLLIDGSWLTLDGCNFSGAQGRVYSKGSGHSGAIASRGSVYNSSTVFDGWAAGTSCTNVVENI